MNVDNGADHLRDAARDRSRGHGTDSCTQAQRHVVNQQHFKCAGDPARARGAGGAGGFSTPRGACGPRTAPSWHALAREAAPSLCHPQNNPPSPPLLPQLSRPTSNHAAQGPSPPRKKEGGGRGGRRPPNVAGSSIPPPPFPALPPSPTSPPVPRIPVPLTSLGSLLARNRAGESGAHHHREQTGAERRRPSCSATDRTGQAIDASFSHRNSMASHPRTFAFSHKHTSHSIPEKVYRFTRRGAVQIGYLFRWVGRRNIAGNAFRDQQRRELCSFCLRSEPSDFLRLRGFGQQFVCEFR
eukprot:COSAG02_NODE_131_length_34710_cov_17.171159_6_plen_298_part_00